MKAILLSGLLALAALPLQAQTPEGRVYTPGAFEGIEIGGSAEVRYTQGPNDQVFVEGSAEMQKSLSLDVRNGLLRVHSSGAWKFWNDQRLRLLVTSRQLQRLSISGAADFTAAGPVQTERLLVTISGAGLARFDKLNAEQLNFGVSGAGDGQFAGRTQQLIVAISGKSEFRGENLAANRARVTVSGIGDVKVWAVDELSIVVSGIGNVEYWGAPTIVREQTSGPATINQRGSRPVPPVAPVAPVAPVTAPAPVPAPPDVRPMPAPAPKPEPRPASR